MEYEYTDEQLGFNETYMYDESMLSDDPLVQYVGLFVVTIYIASFSIGIPANIYVLFRMRRLAGSDNERYRNGTGVALCSMASADLCALLLIFAQNVQQMIGYPDGSSQLTSGMCKVMLFLTHTVTGVSIWSWLLLSCLRYLAICHPLYHLRLWQMPYRALAFIISMSVLLNAWLLVAVESTAAGCTQVSLMRNSLAANRLFHIVECAWSFCIPCVVIIVVDTNVLFKSNTISSFVPKCFTDRNKGETKKKRRKSALEEIIKLTRSNSMRLKNRHQRALFKWLAIALICVLLNAPENIYRLFILFSFSESGGAFNLAARMLAQSLYFSQFAFNAIYLAVFVYDKNTRSKSEQHKSDIPAIMRSRVPSTTGSLRERDSPKIQLQKPSFARVLNVENFPQKVLVQL